MSNMLATLTESRRSPEMDLLTSLRDAVLLIAAVLLLIVAAGLVISLPDLIRYIKIRAM
ncbi:MAG: DUF6893 family small protein [Thermomicrobiales bacterium]